MTRDHVDLGDVCPACHEPWLRPTNLPGRYRCVNCLLCWIACPDCAFALERAGDDMIRGLTQLGARDILGASDEHAGFHSQFDASFLEEGRALG